MGRRIDYYDDPNAPTANSLVPAVNVLVTNDVGDILLILRTDNDHWSLPGGTVDVGESLREAAVREAKEETGIDCEITGILGIYSDPKHVIHYTSNDEVRQEFTIALTARAVGGQPTSSDESREVRWVEPAVAAGLRMHPSMRRRIEHYVSESPCPYLD